MFLHLKHVATCALYNINRQAKNEKSSKVVWIIVVLRGLLKSWYKDLDSCIVIVTLNKCKAYRYSSVNVYSSIIMGYIGMISLYASLIIIELMLQLTN